MEDHCPLNDHFITQSIKLLFFLTLIVHPLLLFPDTLQKPYYCHRETIRIHDSGFSSMITVTGQTVKSGTTIRFPISSMTEMRSYQAWERKKGKMKRIKEMHYHLRTIPMGNEFYNESQSLATFTLPENIFYKVQYETGCNERMLLNFLSFNPTLADTTVYILVVPKNLSLFYRITDTTYIEQLDVDSTESDSVMNYRFSAISKEIYRSISLVRESPFYNARSKVPGIQLVIVPSEFKANPAQYMNLWYTQQLKVYINPTPASEEVIEDIVMGAVQPDSIISRLYYFARDKIRYINVYSGMETIIPKNVNDILDLKMGDCKDKANFLCQALKHEGFDARLAICSSRDHPFDMDFPSFSGGNHMICVVRNQRDQGWMVLDPTNQAGSIYRPGSYIESRTLFILGMDGEPVSTFIVPLTENNEISLNMDLQEEGEKLIGELHLACIGYAGDFLRVALRVSGNINHNRFLMEFLHSLASMNDYSDVTYDVLEDSVLIHCRVAVPASMITKTSGKYYIQMKFIPCVHKNFSETGSDDLLISYIIADRATILIRLKQPITSLKMNTTSISGDPMFISTARSSGNILDLQYALRIKSTVIPPKSQKQFFDCMKQTNPITNFLIQ